MRVRCYANEGVSGQRDNKQVAHAVKQAFQGTGGEPAVTVVVSGGANIVVEGTAVLQPRQGPRSVLVTSATGRIGREVVARLAQSGKFRVRACCHNPDTADYLKKLGAHEVVKFLRPLFIQLHRFSPSPDSA